MGAPEHGLSQVEVHDKSGQLMSAASLETNYLGLLPIRLFAYSPIRLLPRCWQTRLKNLHLKVRCPTLALRNAQTGRQFCTDPV